MAKLNFDANQVEPSTAFEAVPAGKYMAVVTQSEMKPTKKGDGSFLELTLEVIEGEHKGRKVWDRLVLDHPNPMTVKIARAKLSALCRAVGVMQPQDSAQLHNLPVGVAVKCKKREDTGELNNEVVSYHAKEDLKGRPAQATSDTPPWRR